jgi:hypothetical protein
MAEVKSYKVLSLPSRPSPNSIYWVKGSSASNIEVYITDKNSVAYSLKNITETDPVFQASEAALFQDGDKNNLDNQSGINTNDETTSSIQTKRPIKTVNYQSLEGEGNVNIVNGLFAQYEDSIYVGETTSEESLIGAGVETLSVPADTFTKGDSFQANLMGKISCVNTATLHIRVKTSGGILLVDTGIMNLDTCTDKCWKLDLNFTIRSNGGAGSASIASGGLFSYVKNAGTNFEGVCFNFVNETTFDTTIDNELEVTAQWNTTNTSNKIFSQIFTLNKIF